MVKLRGGWVLRAAFGVKTGTPDLILCYKGRAIGCELKVGNNKASAEQLEELHDIKEAGGIAMVCYSLDEIKMVLDAIDGGNSNEDIQLFVRLPERRNQGVGIKKVSRFVS